MEKESIEFKAPEGMEVPEGLAVGDTFEVMATLALGEEGELYLREIDGLPVSTMQEEEEEEDMGGEEEMADEGEGGFLEAVERRAQQS